MKFGTIFTLALILIALGLLWAYSESLPFGSEVTVYNMFCAGEFKDGKCNGREETANPTTYKAFPEQQTVVRWYGDDGAPKRFGYCAVRDARNWSCQYGIKLDPEEAHVQMVSGEYSEPNAIEGAFFRAPKWHWWWVRLTEKR
jgi:hypothetical protein